MSQSGIGRRAALRTAAVGAAAVGVSGAAATAASARETRRPLAFGPMRVRKRFQLVDRDGKQRFLLQSTKPPVHLGGITYPPGDRGGPDNGSYFIFNDENQNERGGMTFSPDIAHLAFDWPTVDALHLNANVYPGGIGAAMLTMRQMPDPSIPPGELQPEDMPQRVTLGTSNAGDGSVLQLHDSKGKPRIRLHVDGDDNPVIQVLAADGRTVVAQLPPAAEGASARTAEGLSEYLRPPGA